MTRSNQQNKDHKDTIRINFEFPLSEYPYLKMICAYKGLSIKDFATDTLVKAIEKAEDDMLAQIANVRIKDMDKKDLISFDEAARQAGWNDEKI